MKNEAVSSVQQESKKEEVDDDGDGKKYETGSGVGVGFKLISHWICSISPMRRKTWRPSKSHFSQESAQQKTTQMSIRL